MQVRVVTNLTKEYPDMIHVVVFKQPKFFTSSEGLKRPREDVGDDYVPKISSLARTKTLIRDIVLCNNFELFCTFTFNPSKVDRFNFAACWRKMSVWLHHQKDLSTLNGKDFKYLIIPEQHKSGAWHFHALISGYTSTLKPSKLVSSTNRPIYNITSFRSGFTTAVPIDSRERVSSYVTKYITKDFIKTFNQRRFFCSRGLFRPQRFVNSPVLSFSLPLFRHKVAENYDSVEYILDKQYL